MAWICSQVTPTSNTHAIFLLKEFLKTAGWTVVASSDATTLNASGDQLSGFGSGANGLGNTNAWFVIQMPNTFAVGSTLKRQLLFQRSSTDHTWRMAYSIAGFTGGTSTTAPTATDQIFVSGSALGTYTAKQVFEDLYATQPYKLFMGANNAAPYQFYFAPILLANQQYRTSGGFMLDAMAPGSFVAPTGTDATTGDMDPYVFYSQISTTANIGTYAYLLSYMANISSGAGRGFFKAAATGQTSVQFTGCSAVSTERDVQGNPYNSKDTLVPIFWTTSSGTAAAASYFKGVSTVASYVMQRRDTGDSLSVASSSAKDYIYVGSCALPWDGTTPVL